MASLTLSAPAKLNLFLHITGRRADGYHELQTLFQLLDYGDFLSFSTRDDGDIRLAVDGEMAYSVPDSEDNLIVRAAKRLQVITQCRQGADIRLEKRLPVGGGLGGGSSDAASTLLALNTLWHTHCDIATLQKIGLLLGADVPVFIRGRTAWAEGIGERLETVDIPPSWYAVVYPNCAVSTAKIFNDAELTRNSPPITIRAFRAQGAGNVCQAVVEKQYPEVQAARLWLAQYAPAQLTGTGSCVFATLESREQADSILADLPQDWRGFVAQGINQSPVYRELGV